MLFNTTQTVRFYIRAKGGENDQTPLRMKVWNGAGKRWLYVSTDLRITPYRFRKELATDGTPTAEAVPAFAKNVERYRAAAVLVLSSAVVNNRIVDITSEYLNRRVNGIVQRMRANAGNEKPQPILVGASPMDEDAAQVCRGCKYFGEKCTAPWSFAAEADTAAEFAAYNGICRMRQERQDGEEGGEA